MGQFILKATGCNVRTNRKYFGFKSYANMVLLGTFLSLVIGLSNASAAMKLEKMNDAVYAYVGEQSIALEEYKQALQNVIRSKFYHGKIPEGKMEEVQRDTGKELISKMLMIQEAQRRKLKPDEKFVSETLDETVKKYEQQYGSSKKWPEYKARFVPRLKKHLQNKSIVTQLEEEVSNIPAPATADIRKYYRNHKEKFTSPEQLKVSVILLQVTPSSPVSAWDEAMDEGRKIYKKLQGGANFEELAKLHSADASAENGGDLGYLHKGMLAKKIQDVVDKLEVGEISKPINVLRGIAIFRLQDRKKSILNPFEKVKDRAGRLWQREQAKLAREKLIDSLWQSSQIKINSKYYKDALTKSAGNEKK
ncbi:Survival protein SurA precursor (Peptidyl-prolyl cis-trans isomerase SurA) [hydrothermal vent metagenome]|uniref:Survival protein SurA (Peptidyl-prolyl cis-trans isomerase SurA) n=1 Tax=hydrothermal vent metagenome TaxID=652676 RepID=A0A3B1C946_9ZZZZ